MEATKQLMRRNYAIQVGFLLVGVLCGALIVAVIKEAEHTSHPAAPAAVVAMPYESPGVLGGRLGGIESADTANDAAIRNELGPSGAAGSLSRSVGEDFILPGDIDGGTLDGRITQFPAPVIGGRLGGLDSADTPNDDAVKQDAQDSGAALRNSNLAGQRDVNAAAQSGQSDTFPIFRPGHDW